jgi:hypothetical protein
MTLELFVWAIVGGLFLALLGGAAVYYRTQTLSTKQLSRDFIVGAAVTGIMFPLLPETLSDMQGAIPTIHSETSTALASSGIDPDVKIGPANF